MKGIKRLTVVASLALIAAAVTAAPASAMHWSSTGFTKLNGTLTLKRAGGSPVNCTVSATSDVAEPEAGWLTMGEFYLSHTTTCANGLTWEWKDWGEVVGALSSGTAPVCCYSAPSEGFSSAVPWAGKEYFAYWAPTPETFVNGSGTSHSYIEFGNDTIGQTLQGELVTATGKLEIKRSTGALLTILP
jgi:hypothetical protein